MSMASKCSKCNKEIGGLFNGGHWDTHKGKKYCGDCLENLEKPKQKGSLTNSAIIAFKGMNGKIELYETYVRIDRGTALGFLYHGLKGQKDIYFDKITSIQIKKPGITVGYIQFSFGGGNESKRGVVGAVKDENTITFAGSEQYKMALEIKEYVEQNRHPTQKTHFSIADEIEKLANLLDKGILTKKEFEDKKRELLNR